MSLSRQLIDNHTHNNQEKRKYTKKTNNPMNVNCLSMYKTCKNMPQFTYKNCSFESVYIGYKLCYTIQHKTILIIFPLILQTIITVQICLQEERGGTVCSVIWIVVEFQIASTMSILLNPFTSEQNFAALYTVNHKNVPLCF